MENGKDRRVGRDSGPTPSKSSSRSVSGSSLALTFPLPAACSKVSSRQQTGLLILRIRQRKSGDHGDKSWKSDRRRSATSNRRGGVLGSDQDDDQGPPGDRLPPLEDAPSKLGLGPISHAPPLKYPPAPSSTGPRLPVVFTFYHHLRPKGLFFATSPFASPSFTFCEFPKLQSTPFTPPRPSITSTVGLSITTPPNPLLRNPEPARCHSGIFTPSKRHPQPHDLSDQPQRSSPVKPSCEITPIELLSDIPRRHPRSVIILEGPNVTAVLSQLALNLSDLQDIDCRDRFSLLATQRYVRSSRLASAPCKGWARTGSSPVGRVHFMSRDQCLYFFRQ